MMSDNHLLIKNTFIYAVGDIIPKIIGLLVMPIMTLYLVPAEYGIINYVNAITIFMGIFGMLSVNTYYLVFYYRQPDDESRQRLLGTLTIFVIGVNFTLLVLSLFFGEWIFGIFGSRIDFFPYIALGIATSCVQMLSVLPSALYRLREKPLTLSTLVVLRSFLQAGGGIAFVIWWGFDASGVLWANFLVSALFAIIFMVITYRNAIFRFDISILRRALKFSLPLIPGSVAYSLISVSDRIFIEKYLTSTDLGIYGTAANLALMLNLISYGAYKAFEPHFFKKFGSSDFAVMFSRVRNGFLLIILVGVLSIGLFAREFFEIFTAPLYHQAYYYVPMILVGVLSYSMMVLYGTIVTAKGLTKTNSLITIIGGCVSVTLNILLLPLLGLSAAALVSGISFTTMMIGSIYYARMRIDHFRPFFCVVLCGTFLYLGVYILPPDGFWLPLSVKLGLIVLCSTLMLLILQIRYRNLALILRGR